MPWVRRAIFPYILMTQVVPKVALAPILVAWFGIGMQSRLILAFLIAMGARRHRFGVVVAIVVAVGYGAVDELHQAQVPGRDSSWGDLAADAVGALLGAALATAYDRRRHADRP